MSATSASSQTRLRALYRALLRELPQRSLSSPLPIKQYMRAHIRGTGTATESSSSQEPTHPMQIAQLEQFIQYARAQRVYTTLLERYNPGMSMDEEQRVRLTMRRVGMDAPEEWRGGSGE